MIDKLLVSWSVLASIAVAVSGTWVALSPHGAAMPGVALILLGASVGLMALAHARDWGRYRLRTPVRKSSAPQSAVRVGQRAASAAKAASTSRQPHDTRAAAT